MKVYAVRILHNNGRLGYHSVWASRELAERQVFIRGNGYFVEEKVPTKWFRFPWEKQTNVWFEDSVGGLLLLSDVPVY